MVALCYRFCHYARTPGARRTGFTTAQELEDSLLTCIRAFQHGNLPREIHALDRGNNVHAGSPLRALQPMLDERRLLRVGGRIQSANLPYAERHPLILPKDGHLTALIVRNAHLVPCMGDRN